MVFAADRLRLRQDEMRKGKGPTLQSDPPNDSIRGARERDCSYLEYHSRGHRMPDVGCRMSDAECRISFTRVWGVGMASASSNDCFARGTLDFVVRQDKLGWDKSGRAHHSAVNFDRILLFMRKRSPGRTSSICNVCIEWRPLEVLPWSALYGRGLRDI